jgi:hypothetical protein
MQAPFLPTDISVVDDVAYQNKANGQNHFYG